MPDPLLIVAALVFLCVVFVWLRTRRLRLLSVDRLTEPFVEKGTPGGATGRKGLLPGRRVWIPLGAAVLAFLLLHYAGGLSLPLSVALALVIGIVSFLVAVHFFESRNLRLETQLADAIDLVVGSLGAGASSMDALESSSREAPEPLKTELTDVVGRIQLGDAPRDVFDELARRVDLESFHLFSFTMLVHEETGGSLAPILSSVGRTIRDRIDLARRVRAEATQSQASVVGILLITYAIAFVTWRTSPERMEGFLLSEGGARFAAAAVIAQAFGLLWMSRMSRIRY